MDIRLSFTNHGNFLCSYRAFGFSTRWRWFDKYHGKPYESDHQHYVDRYYGWFYYSRHSTCADGLLWNIKTDNLKGFLDWNSCNDIDEFIEKNEKWIPKRQLKKIRKYQRKLEKIVEYRKDYGIR